MGKEILFQKIIKMSTRPTVSVFNHKNTSEVVAEVKMPHVFLAPVRNDLVTFVHDQLSKNSRQAHGVDKKAGMRHSAESWGTGRAVARIPRVSGSGTHRSGQGAFGNMCRKGRMSHPLQTWRRWHRKVNLTQRRHALASAVAATACTPLVMARGHRVLGLNQMPLVLDDAVGQVAKTKDAIALLKSLGLWEDVRRVMSSKNLRSGKGTAPTKKGYRLQNEVVTSADLSGLINSDAIQSVVRDAKMQAKRTRGTKANPLRNRRAMAKLNPYSTVLREMRKKTAGVVRKITKAERKTKSGRSRVAKKALNGLLTTVEAEVDGLTQIYKSQIASMNIKP